MGSNPVAFEVGSYSNRIIDCVAPDELLLRALADSSSVF